MSNFNRGGYSSSQGQGFLQDSFGNDGAPTKRSYNNHSLRPVTIKQIMGASQTQADGDFKIDGHEISQVTVIAAVRMINRAATQNTYTVEDGTGVIDARRYPSDTEDVEETNSITEGEYVRIVGNVKNFNNKQFIQVHSIRPVTDMNELTYHNLEVLYVHVSATRNKDGSSDAYGHHNNSNSNMHGGGLDAHMRGGNDADDAAQSIIDFINQHPGKSSGVGTHRRDIISQFAQRLGGDARVNELIATMIDGGHLYTTQDDDHLNTTY